MPTTTNHVPALLNISVDISDELERIRSMIADEFGPPAFDVSFSPRHWAVDLPALAETHDSVRFGVNYVDETVSVHGRTGQAVCWSVRFDLSTPFAVIAAVVYEACGLNQ